MDPSKPPKTPFFHLFFKTFKNPPFWPTPHSPRKHPILTPPSLLLLLAYFAPFFFQFHSFLSISFKTLHFIIFHSSSSIQPSNHHQTRIK
jgi:hypothetical protein